MTNIYRMTGPSADGDPLFAWKDNSGYMHVLGDRAEVSELHAALSSLLAGGSEPETISEYDPAWGRNYTISQAVEEAIVYGYGTDRERMADSIRAAARAGRIRGATQVDGRWSIPPLTLRGWLVRSREEKRGRPRRAEQQEVKP